MSDYEAKIEAKRQRLHDAADKAQARSNRARQTADAIHSAIPLGQPILVGHHSERRHRRDLDRAHRAFGAAIEEDKRAHELRSRAETYGTHVISSDDPEAVAKLRARLAEITELRAIETRANATMRRAAKALSRDLTRADHIALIDQLERDGSLPKYAADAFRSAARAFGWLPRFGPNTGAEIRRVERRIADLEREHARRADAPAAPLEIGDTVIEEDADINRISIRFRAGPPGREMARRLRSEGWRWAPSRGVWSRRLTNAARASAQRVLAPAAPPSPVAPAESAPTIVTASTRDP